MNRFIVISLFSGSLALTSPGMAVADPPQWTSTSVFNSRLVTREERASRGREHRQSRHYRDNRLRHQQRYWQQPGYRHRSQQRYYRHPSAQITYIQVQPGWHHQAYVGQRLPRDLHRQRYHLPNHGRVQRRQSGITELIIANQIIRIVDATQTIIYVSRH